MKKASLYIFLSLYIFSCQSTATEADGFVKKESQFQNIYELSEMSELMETMYLDMEQLRQRILEGTHITSEEVMDYSTIYTAEMSDDFENDEVFQHFSEIFLNHFTELYDNESELDLTKRFNTTVNSCINCHKSEVGCFGPIPRIKKLLIP